MTDWTKAGAVPGLMGAGAPPMPPGAPALPASMTGGGTGGTALIPHFGTWPLFGYSVLVIIGSFLVIPAPWVMTMFYRRFIPEIELPNGRRVTFAGEPLDIWYIFMLGALLGYAGFIHQALPLVLLPLNALFNLMIVRWVMAKLRWDGQGEPLRFVGSYWGLLGWFAFLWVSLLSIIGWAWVATAMGRWMCRNIEGAREELTFVASGWGLLWRFFVFAIACGFIIPIPWMIAWFTRWMVSQYHLGPRQA
jgi:hypothetical protein